MGKINSISAREILDSRGNPTIETKVVLNDGSIGTSSVPSGASKGLNEAVELRDNDKYRYRGMGVLKAVSNVNNILSKQLVGLDSDNLNEIDQKMIDIDGTKNKSILGANSILSVSMAVCEAESASKKMPLFVYLNEIFCHKYSKIKTRIPIPAFNVINGGKHGNGNNLNFQEYHLIPSADLSFSDSLRLSVKIYQSIGNILHNRGLTSSIGDEGGYAPDLNNNKAGFELIREAILLNKYEVGKDFFLGVDCSANSFTKNSKYLITDFPKAITKEELINYYLGLVKSYSLLFIEDGINEDDWSGWQELNEKAKNSLIIGDDLLCTNVDLINQAIMYKACSGAIIKINQVGTITETLEAIHIAKQAGLKIIVSHRSGETDEDFIADLSVGVAADLVKFGAPCRGERIAKYNRLLEIEPMLV